MKAQQPKTSQKCLKALSAADRYRLKVRNELKAKFKKRFPDGAILDTHSSFLE